jgi:hypothetical protein
VKYNRLYILVEGDDDVRFFKRVIEPGLQKVYDYVLLYRYASRTSKKIEKFIDSIDAMKADYIVVADVDHSPCMTQKKKSIKNKKIRNVNENKIIVVIKEIESWYMAGLEEKSKKEIGIKHNESTTDSLSKEQFNHTIPKKFISRIDFMQEILKYFKMKTAIKNNKSFAYFIARFELPKTFIN